MRTEIIPVLASWVDQTIGQDNHLPGLPLVGARIIVRSFCREDEEKRQRWKKYDDPLLYKYNFNPQQTAENDRRFALLQNCIRLAVDLPSGELIGYISFKPAERAHASAELGVCFSADYVNQGYGSEALSLALPWARERLTLPRILLEVDAANQRAWRLYQRLGFRVIRQFWRREQHPEFPKSFTPNKRADEEVRWRNGQIEVLTWIMEWCSASQSE